MAGMAQCLGGLKLTPLTQLRKFFVAIAAAVAAAFSAFAGIAAPAEASAYQVTSLTTDNDTNLTGLGFPAVPPANVDPKLINPWGVSFGPATPFWVSDNGTGVSTLYTAAGAPAGGPLVVTIADAVSPATPTGQVFNGNTSNFNISGCNLAPPACSANFIFDTENGTISGRSNTFNRTQSFIEVNNSGSGAVYKGLAIANITGSNYIYATNFNSGMVEEYNSSWGLVRTFTDPNQPSGYAPFNVQLLDGKLYVTFAVQDAAKHDDVAGGGNGFVDVFDLSGNFLERLIDPGGVLNSPWGLAIAPAGFGAFAGDLLIGNFGNGEIDAFDPTISNDFLGTLNTVNGYPLVIPGLWALTIGNSGPGVNPNAIYFTAGLPSSSDPTLLEQHGLFGALTVAVPEPPGLAVLAAGLVFLGVWQFARRSTAERT